MREVGRPAQWPPRGTPAACTGGPLNDPYPTAVGGARDAWPDARVGDRQVDLTDEAPHRRTVGQDHTDRAGLSSAPPQAAQRLVALVERPSPLMGDVVVRRRRDLLCEAESARRHSHEIHESDGAGNAHHDHAVTCGAVEEAALAKALGDCAQNRRCRVPDRPLSVGPRGWPVVIEAGIGMRTPSPPFVPASVGGADAHESEAARKDRDGRPRRQVRR